MRPAGHPRWARGMPVRLAAMVELRQLQRSDLPRVREIFSEAFGVATPPPLEYFENLCHTEPEGCFVATVAGAVVGYACSHRSGRIGYLGNLAVASGQRGRGLGKAVTIAARDHLAARCDVVGLAVEPDSGRNLSLYAACGFTPTLPSACVGRFLRPDRDRTVPASIRTAAQLGPGVHAAIRYVATWTPEVVPGLDCTRDLEHFARAYPDQLSFAFEGDEARGFLAYHELFRGDPWCAVRPGPRDVEAFDALVDAVEASTPDDVMLFHFSTSFRRVQEVLSARGYRVNAHKTCLLLEGRDQAWPHASDALFMRPWWS